MTDWRSKLRKALEHLEATEQHERSQRESVAGRQKEFNQIVAEFIKRTVVPAFEDLKTELKQHERDISIHAGDLDASLEIRHLNRLEFQYAITVLGSVCRTYECIGKQGTPLETQGPGELRNKDGLSAPSNITKEIILSDFTDQYERCLRHRSCS